MYFASCILLHERPRQCTNIALSKIVLKYEIGLKIELSEQIDNK